MGFLDFVFSGSKTRKKKKIFVTTREVEKTLFRLGTLNQEQRMTVKSIIVKHMDSGGVSVEEFKNQVLPKLYKLVQEGKLSSVDYQKLKSLLFE